MLVLDGVTLLLDGLAAEVHALGSVLLLLAEHSYVTRRLQDLAMPIDDDVSPSMSSISWYNGHLQKTFCDSVV